MKPEVIVYTVPGWQNCASIRQFLSGKGIPYTEKSVLVPKNFIARLKATNQPGGPVTIVGEKILMRFSLKEFEDTFKDY